ncbi:hypothetical protein BV898_08633 [Hypsibius exemplaris]|uniref:MSL3 chromodomain-like domain-containing protein n=1 Tax=Hypsibius exemplaris TaxID=2072580 RepID=A0A1W0WPU8_HYPEX|nr:hypothetical protein BV898_08633 [Hypsibius exemplaris]
MAKAAATRGARPVAATTTTAVKPAGTNGTSNNGASTSVPENGAAGKFTAAQLKELQTIYTVGDNVWVMTKGLWSKAKVIKTDQAKHPEDAELAIPTSLVHYPGWSASFDEWVIGDSIMPQTPENEIRAVTENDTVKKSIAAPAKQKKTVAKKEKAAAAVKEEEKPKKQPYPRKPSSPKAAAAPRAATARRVVAEGKAPEPEPTATTTGTNGNRAARKPAVAAAAVAAEAAKPEAVYDFVDEAAAGQNGTKKGRGGAGARNGKAEAAPATEKKTTPEEKAPAVKKAAAPAAKTTTTLTAHSRLKRQAEVPESAAGPSGAVAVEGSPQRVATPFDLGLVGAAEKLRLACANYINIEKLPTEAIGDLVEKVDELTTAAGDLKDAALNFLNTNSKAIVASAPWKAYAERKPEDAAKLLREAEDSSPAKKQRVQ